MSISDEYMQTIHPELWSAQQAEWGRLYDLMAEAVAGRSEEELRADRRAMWRDWLAAHDDGILRFFGKNADFLLDALEQERRHKDAGKALPQDKAAMRREAYRAFADVAARGGKRKDAVNAALERIALISPNRHPDHKTVRAWWDAIEAKGGFKIQKRE